MSDAAPRRPPLALAAILLLGFVAVLVLRPASRPHGNAVVVVNAGSRGLDSVTVRPHPPGSSPLAGRAGYVASRDSTWVVLPAARGDADIRVWRDGRVVANHLALFGGRSWFEVRVGDSAQVGRYRDFGVGR